MEMLVKNYGIMLRIQYKQKLSHWLSPLLEPGEDVYQLSGNDLALRLNTESHQERITALDSHLKQFRFFWDGMPMQPQIGVSYCYVRSPVNPYLLTAGRAKYGRRTFHRDQRPRKYAASRGNVFATRIER